MDEFLELDVLDDRDQENFNFIMQLSPREVQEWLDGLDEDDFVYIRDLLNRANQRMDQILKASNDSGKFHMAGNGTLH
jgi:5-bromo-4-chloroindolyl phosphate hydrolysis protein